MPMFPSRRSAPLLLGLLLLPAAQAAAHAVVVTSDPPVAASLATPPAEVVIHFNSRIDHARSRLILVGPDAVQAVLEPATQAEPTVLQARCDPKLVPWAPGAWRLRWQVLAVDGHITRGDIPFTLMAP